MARQIKGAGETETVTEAQLGLGNPDPDCTYTLRSIPLEEMKRINRQNTPRVPDRRTGRMVNGETDEIGSSFDIFDYCLVGWTGLTFPGGSTDCTRAHKELLVAARPGIVRAIAQYLGTGAQEGQEDSFRGPA